MGQAQQSIPIKAAPPLNDRETEALAERMTGTAPRESNPQASVAPDVIELMLLAHERVLKDLQEVGQVKDIRQRVVRGIIAAAHRGETDPERLYQAGLQATDAR